MDPGTTASCWAAHMGLLACEPRFARAAVAAVKSGLPLTRATTARPSAAAPTTGNVPGESGMAYWTPVGEGVAMIRIDGPTAKGFGKFGEMSTVFVRRAIRAASTNPDVASILLVIDSPGGYVAGTDDLARDVAAANEVKPVVAFIEDLGASAAYWVASQARAVYANPTAQVGSIGVFAVIEDASKAAEVAGVTVHVLSTGPLKGAGAEGAPVTPEQLAAWQTEIDDTMAHFAAAVRKGRNMTPKGFAEVATGGTWIASKAKDLGLIDGVRTLDATVAAMPKPRRTKADAADVAIRLAEAE